MRNKKKIQTILTRYGEKFHELKKLIECIHDKKSGKLTQGHLAEPPVRVFVEPTNKCNKTCHYCAQNSMDRNEEFLSMTSFEKVIQGLPEGTNILMTGNGEPLLNPDIYPMIDMAVERGFIVGMTTNGTVLTEKNARKLIETGINRVQISFDSVIKEVYEASYSPKINGPLSFESMFEKILKFIYLARTEFARNNPFITIASVLTEDVKLVSERNRNFWNKTPIDNYYEGPLLSLQSNAGTYEQTDYTTKESWKICVNPFTSMKINSDGSVNSCIQDFSNKYSVGGMKDKSIKNIYNSPKAIKLRKALIEQDIEYLSKIGYNCHQCNAWTSEAKHDIEGYLQNSYPITYGLMMYEVDRERCYPQEKVEYLKAIIDNFPESLETI